MDEFDLGRLTDRDFEAVCRDLFTEILGVPLEVFPRGRDGGIDLRHVAEGGFTTIVQCKHWHRSGTAKLLRALASEEAPKVRRMRPDRYLLATTVRLSAEDKWKIVGDLSPYIRTPGDVYGVDDLVTGLRDRPGIVRRHFRLWLSSTTVLQTVLHQAGHLRSAWLRDELTRVARTFVPHDGFERAREILDLHQVCIVTGPPGVGKTTVAMMLAAWLMGHGYRLYEVAMDVDEVLDLWHDDEPQVFLYDDFLGRTMLEPPTKNEDRRLASLVRRIRETPGKALIMTSRDHILSEARRRSDRLAGRDLTAATSAVELSDLDIGVRAQILYNYVYLSAIDPAEKVCFSEPRSWGPIVRHPQFSPRLVEETLRLTDHDGKDVAGELLTNLNNPLHIWERIVENELPSEAVHLLEVLFVAGRTPVEDLTEAWTGYRTQVQCDADGRLLRRAMRTLDGVLIRIDAVHNTDEVGRLVQYHNPSVEDYFRHHVATGRADVPALLTMVSDNHRAYRLVEAARDEALRGHLDLVEAKLIEAGNTVEDSPSPEDDSKSTYLGWVLTVAERLQSSRLAQYVMSYCDIDLVRREHPEHLVELANSLSLSSMIPNEFATGFSELVGRGIGLDVDELIERMGASFALELYELLNHLDAYIDDSDLRSRLEAGLSQRLDELVTQAAQGLADYEVAELKALLDFLQRDDADDAKEIIQRAHKAQSAPRRTDQPAPQRSDDIAALMRRLRDI